jgi:hypothetical protein
MSPSSTFMRRRRSVPSGRNFRCKKSRSTLFQLGIFVIEIMGIILFTYVLSGIWGMGYASGMRC